jgi:PPP family 3-phenylpropionic acid transporter
MLKTCLRPPVFSLLLACFLIQASHGPYYTFFSIYAEDNGYSRSIVGQLWSLGVLAEVAVFYYMYRWLPKYGAKFLLVTAMLLTVIRWWLIAYYVEYLSILLFAQLLHAASYGLFHASAIHLIDEYFPGKIQGRGQALFSSISFGLGGSLGSLVSGYTWNSIGPSYVYLLAMGIAQIALIQFIWIVKPRMSMA